MVLGMCKIIEAQCVYYWNQYSVLFSFRAPETMCDVACLLGYTTSLRVYEVCMRVSNYVTHTPSFNLFHYCDLYNTWNPELVGFRSHDLYHPIVTLIWVAADSPITSGGGMDAWFLQAADIGDVETFSWGSNTLADTLSCSRSWYWLNVVL